MKLAKANPSCVATFEALAREVKGGTQRPIFGQPGAFLGGNLYFGVFGDQIFVRLGEATAAEALRLPGARPFEPMAGRAMKGYVVLPEQLWADPTQARVWVQRAAEFAATLPPKSGSSRRARAK